MNTVICPHCKKTVEISEALKHQFESEQRAKIEAEYQKKLEAGKQEAVEDSAKKLREQFEFQIKQAQEDSVEKEARIKKLIDQITELTQELRKSKQERDEVKIEMQKQLMAEEEKIRIEERKKAEDEQRLKNLEKDKQLQDALKANEEMRRKLQQGSQQTQGEVLELDLEQQLQEQFPADEITPVPKGVEGADIAQKVRNKYGQTAGLILWETKRTKAWSSSWTAKLREDKRRMNASLAILVSDVMPNGIENFGMYENIWVCSYQYALPLVNILRIGLFELAVAKSATANKDEKLEALFSYLVSDGFRNRFEAQVESIVMLRSDLETEQRSTIRMWKKREMQIKRLMSSVATMYGELQGVMGEALPSLPSLDSGMLPEVEQENLLE
ncbi:MAG TPA: DUF2130 domain-containing protein [Candidatus Acidoferrales bacterium]|nr:DUF2130 domain-containing protein [Candidatus Acidoferrales bacterium]